MCKGKSDQLSFRGFSTSTVANQQVRCARASFSVDHRTELDEGGGIALGGTCTGEGCAVSAAEEEPAGRSQGRAFSIRLEPLRPCYFRGQAVQAALKALRGSLRFLQRVHADVGESQRDLRKAGSLD